MNKILVIGDSFAADWTSKGLKYPGWVNTLASMYSVTNLAQAGVGEYKILQQLKSVNLDDFDLVIVSHTSHSRIHSSTSFHNTDLHSNCDLIFTDVIDNNLPEAEWFFKYVYDDEFYKYIYGILRKEIHSTIGATPCINIDSFYERFCSQESNVIEISSLWRNNRGEVNHMNEQANKELFNKVNFHILSYER